MPNFVRRLLGRPPPRIRMARVEGDFVEVVSFLAPTWERFRYLRAFYRAQGFRVAP